MFNHRQRYEPCPRCTASGNDRTGDNLVTFPDGGKHCFACGYHVHGAKYYQPKNTETHVAKSLRPTDFTREVPAAALEWLLQFGLPWSYWKETIGFSPSESRLIFEIKDDETLYFTIGRHIDLRGNERGQSAHHGQPLGSTDRRLSMDGTGADQRVPRKWYTWGDPHKYCHVLSCGKTEDRERTVVLVEDLISAAKVSQCFDSIPLFGTKLHDCHWWYLLTNTVDRVVIWLDKDQEEYVKPLAIKVQGIINRRVDIAVTDKDPKYHSKELITNVCYSN